MDNAFQDSLELEKENYFLNCFILNTRWSNVSFFVFLVVDTMHFVLEKISKYPSISIYVWDCTHLYYAHPTHPCNNTTVSRKVHPRICQKIK